MKVGGCSMMSEKEKCALQRAFSTDDGRVALAYLARFARADEAEFCADPRLSEYIQGRRSVVLEIRKVFNNPEGVKL